MRLPYIYNRSDTLLKQRTILSLPNPSKEVKSKAAAIVCFPIAAADFFTTFFFLK
jgi:hypothetical protein